MSWPQLYSTMRAHNTRSPRSLRVKATAQEACRANRHHQPQSPVSRRTYPFESSAPYRNASNFHIPGRSSSPERDEQIGGVSLQTPELPIEHHIQHMSHHIIPKISSSDIQCLDTYDSLDCVPLSTGRDYFMKSDSDVCVCVRMRVRESSARTKSQCSAMSNSGSI